MDVYYNYNSKYHFELPGIDIHVMYFNANKQASHNHNYNEFDCDLQALLAIDIKLLISS